MDPGNILLILDSSRLNLFPLSLPTSLNEHDLGTTQGIQPLLLHKAPIRLIAKEQLGRERSSFALRFQGFSTRGGGGGL